MVGTLSFIQFLVKLRFSWIIYQHQHHRDIHFSGCFISYRAPHKGIDIQSGLPNTACMYHDIPSFLTWRVFLIFCLSLPAAQCWCLLHPLHPLKKQNVSFFSGEICFTYHKSQRETLNAAVTDRRPMKQMIFSRYQWNSYLIEERGYCFLLRWKERVFITPTISLR